MTEYNYLKKQLRQKVNQYYYERLKLHLANFPNVKFNQYVLTLIKPFLKCGKLEKYKDKYFTLAFHNKDYTGYIKFKDNEIIISMSPFTKKSKHEMKKKVIFNPDTIIVLDISFYKCEENFLENTTESIFRNNWRINNLGDNNLIYKKSIEHQNENGKSFFRQEIVKLKNDFTSLVETFDSKTQKILYFKAKAENTSFEDVLTNPSLELKKEEISKEKADYFNSKWLEENPSFDTIIENNQIKEDESLHF